MQVRFIRPVVFVVAMGAAAAGCGKYSISNIRSAKAFQDANVLYRKADYQAAVARYEDSIRFNPELGFAYFFLGNSYENLYKPTRKDDPENMAYLKKAADHYRTAITKLANATEPKEIEVRNYAFEYLISIYGADKLDDFAKAEAIAKEYIEVNPGEASTYQGLAKMYVDQGRFEDAEAYFLKAIDVNPKDASGYVFLAGFYNDRGEFEKTMAAWNKRAEAEPNNAEAWHTIGVYYYDKVFRDKRLSRETARTYAIKGIEAEDKALALNPEYFEALTYKNILLRQRALFERDPALQKSLTEEAERLYKKAMEIRQKQNEAAGAGNPTKKGGT